MTETRLQYYTRLYEHRKLEQVALQHFVATRCTVGAEQRTPIQALYTAWAVWRRAAGYEPSPVQTFGRDLRKIVPSVTPRQQVTGKRFYEGVGLKAE